MVKTASGFSLASPLRAQSRSPRPVTDAGISRNASQSSSAHQKLSSSVLANRHLPIPHEMVEDVRLLLFRLEARTIRLEL
jgi:hypothetical protein